MSTSHTLSILTFLFPFLFPFLNTHTKAFFPEIPSLNLTLTILLPNYDQRSLQRFPLSVEKPTLKPMPPSTAYLKSLLTKVFPHPFIQKLSL